MQYVKRAHRAGSAARALFNQRGMTGPATNLGFSGDPMDVKSANAGEKAGAYVRNAAKHQAVDPLHVEPEAGRYHLHVSLACPWAAGTLSCLFLKGLEDKVSYSVVHPTWQKTKPGDESDQHAGWVFREPGDAPLANPRGHGSNACDDALRPDSATGCASIREIYELAGDHTGPFTVRARHPVMIPMKPLRLHSDRYFNLAARRT